ncbi:MAG: hemolysin III family protein [Clostridia bacterium]|nr:hemolysin III family protein [Clostridia bacterium]
MLTHALGFILCYFIFEACLIPALSYGEALSVVCAGLYLLGTVLMFACSVVYHAAEPTSSAKGKLRVLDHCMIYFAVAGTATGCVPAVYDTVGLFPAVLMIVCAWAGAVGGLVMTLFFFEKTAKARMILYITTAAVCAAVGSGAYFALPFGAFKAFLIGSALLLAGAVFLRLGKKVRYLHCVFHVLILAGLFVYYLGISAYCY